MKELVAIAALFMVLVLSEPRTRITNNVFHFSRIYPLPNPLKCVARPKEFKYRDKHMFLSSNVPKYADQSFEWDEGRILCREICMDLVALDTQEKNNLISRLVKENNVSSVWTAGRICDFQDCEEGTDERPKDIYGWYWASTRDRIPATNRIPQNWAYNPWSQTGPQPDNAEYDMNQTREQCITLQSNVDDGEVAWHDAACYHEKPVICEDSEELLKYVAATNPGIRL